MSTIVVALGGNALIQPGESGTAEEQAANAIGMAAAVGEVATKGHRIVVTHGNGPQVGNLALQQQAARHIVPIMPLDLVGAMTQGYMGSLIVRALWEQLPCHRDRLAAIVTHTLVDLDDEAFSNPTKPIGPFLDDDAENRARSLGWTVAKDSGRGNRRLVPSPRPQGVLEAAAIKSLVDSGYLVVAGGGGGIPIAVASGELRGVDAVVDKDRVAVLIAGEVKADVLALVTGVDHVYLGYGTRDERPVHEMTTDEAARYLENQEFPVGSMGPKVESAIDFINAGGEFVVITSGGQLGAALDGNSGTRVIRGNAL